MHSFKMEIGTKGAFALKFGIKRNKTISWHICIEMGQKGAHTLLKKIQNLLIQDKTLQFDTFVLKLGTKLSYK